MQPTYSVYDRVHIMYGCVDACVYVNGMLGMIMQVYTCTYILYIVYVHGMLGMIMHAGIYLHLCTRNSVCSWHAGYDHAGIVYMLVIMQSYVTLILHTDRVSFLVWQGLLSSLASTLQCKVL
jgi:hypothetical protein